MKIYHNGDRCPCCGTILWNKSREWLLDFSATVYAMGFREEAERDAAPGPSRTPEDDVRICRR